MARTESEDVLHMSQLSLAAHTEVVWLC